MRNRPLIGLVAAMLLATVIATGAAAQSASPAWEQEIHFPAGSIRHLVVNDGYAYVLNGWTRGDGVLVFDVRDPANPRFVNSTTARGYLGASAIHQDVLYVPAVWFALMVIDVSDPVQADITRNMSFNFPGGDVQSLAVEGDRLYLGGRGGGLRILDISQPDAPMIVAHEPRFGRIEQIAVNDGRLVLRPRRGDATLATVADDQLTERATLSLANDFRFVGPALYEATQSALVVHDVSDLGAPEVATRVEGVTPIGMMGSNQMLMRGPGDALSVFDVSNPLEPELLRELALPEDVSLGDAVVDGDMLYALDDARAGLRTFAVGDDAVRPLGERHIVRGAGHMTLGEGEHVFLTHAHGDTLVTFPLELSNEGYTDFPTRHALESEIYTTHNVQRAAAVARVGDYLIVGDGIVDVSDPMQPRTQHEAERAASAIDVRGDLAAVAQGKRVRLLDVSRLPERVVLGAYEPEGDDHHITGVALGEGAAYLVSQADGAYQVEVLDISDPAEPRRVARVEVPEAYAATLHGDLLYVPGELMVVLDVSEPASPEVVNEIDGPMGASRSYRVRAHGDRLYFVDGMQGIKVADITDPRNPEFIESLFGIATHSAAYTDFDIRNGKLYGLRYSHLDVWTIEDY